MTAPTGNKFWKLRTKHGPDALIADPQTLREACEEYFEWVENNPLVEEKVGFYEGNPARADCAKMRAMTIDGLSIFLGIVPRTWRKWRDEREDLIPVIEWAETVMKNQKFCGAASGLLNHHIIARDLGLHDIRAIQNLDADGEPTDPASPVSVGSRDILAAVHAEMKKMDEAKEAKNDIHEKD